MATSALKQVFLSSENALVLALKFFANSPDCNRNGKFKDNISVIILETICSLTEEHPHITNDHSSDNLSMVVFNFTKKGMKPKLIQQLAKSYNMKNIKDLLIPKIHDMLKENEYQSAAYWAIALEITNDFTIYDIIVPLIFRELHEVTTKYLDEAKDLQRPLIEFLDTLMDNQYTVPHYIGDLTAKYHYDISNTGKCRITAKSLRNQIDKLARRYKIPFEATPYTSFSKNLSYINYLLHKRYIEGDQMSREALRELVKEAAVTLKLQEELIITICQYGDRQEAKYFLDFYKLSSNLLPCGSFDDIELGEKSKSDEKNSNFHKLKLPMDKIAWVDSDESIANMIKDLESCTVVAFDSEWKPHSSNNDEAVSLLQLAIPSKVFLVDALSNKITANGWKNIGNDIFNNLEITKIGFSITHDLQMFFKYLPDMEFTFMHLSPNYLDLDTLWNKLNDISYFTFPYQKYNVDRDVPRGCKTSSKTGGLSMLAQLCFGKKLDKSNQISNWGNRPLRHDQVVYAAIDAYCLIEIYDLLINRILQFNCSAKMLMTDVMLADQKRLTKIEKTVKKNKVFNSKHKQQSNKVQKRDDDSTMKVQRCEEPPTKRTEVQKKSFTNAFIYEDQLGTPTSKRPGRRGPYRRSSKDISFTCFGTQFEGLAVQLRKLGVHCEVFDRESSSIQNFVEYVESGGLVVICNSSAYSNRLWKYDVDCYVVNNDKAVKLLISDIIREFRIQVTKEDVFSRCVACNSGGFFLAQRRDMQTMISGVVHSEGTYKTPPPRNFNFLRDIPTSVIKSKVLENGQVLQVEKIPVEVINNNDLYYFCDNCGKCYWDGSHLDLFLSGPFFREILCLPNKVQ